MGAGYGAAPGRGNLPGACSFPELGCQVSGIGKGVRTFGILFERDYNDCDVREIAAKLCSTYPTDLDGSLSDEFIQLKHFVQNETSPVQLLP